MHEIDRSFRAKRMEAAERRARALRRRILSGAAATIVVGLAVAAYVGRQYWLPEQQPAATAQAPVDQGAAPTAAPAAKQRPVFVNPIIDLAGDPLIIRLAQASDADSKLRDVPVAKELKQPAVPDEVEILSDVMLSASERIMALPSSPEDFAFFQSQSARSKPLVSVEPAAEEPPPDAPAAEQEPADPDSDEVLVPVAGQDDLETDAGDAPAAEETVIEDGIPTDLGADEPQAQPPAQPEQQTGEIGEPDADMGAGWGETIDQGQQALPSFTKTAIADITTVQLVKPEAERFRQVEDFTVSVKGERSLDSIITEYGFSADDAAKAVNAAKAEDAAKTGDADKPEDAKKTGNSKKTADAKKADAEKAADAGTSAMDKLGDRYIVRLRGYRAQSKYSPLSLVQVSVYQPPQAAGKQRKYLGTIARRDDGSFAPGADPWIKEYLPDDDTGSAAAPQQSYRLLDAIYSTATRNSVPSSVTGEAIMLVSRAFDLQAMATKDDRLVLAYAKGGGRSKDGSAGRVLYVAIKGVDRNFECFVYQPQPDADFACMSEKDATYSITVTSGMVTPVKGVMTSTFGPRLHPILHKVRIHKGVDWGAPLGTPIVAAFDGTIAYAGDGKGYGNVIRIDHGGGKATAYAHMSRFEKGIAKGVQVKAGDTIGYVGTTGLSTGPHLHFEVYLNGVAVDPLGSALAGGPSAGETVEAAAVAGSDGTAVELLVNRIIHVESGGNARAKNPLSSAAGLGQFIKSTWLRMVRTYRPELFRSMSEGEILELRYDPTMAREMVGNLARENEARLRAHGHSITAGRLYLAHFLGPEGAHLALAAPGSALVADVLGTSVIGANPFLTGKDCNYVVAWAEKKMTGKAPRYASSGGGAAAVTKTVVRTSPEFITYRETMLKLVELAAAPQAAPSPEDAAADGTAATNAALPTDGETAGEGQQDGGEQPADAE